MEPTEKLHGFSKDKAMKPFKKAKKMRTLQNLPQKMKFDLSDPKVHQLNLYYGELGEELQFPRLPEPVRQNKFKLKDLLVDRKKQRL